MSADRPLLRTAPLRLNARDDPERGDVPGWAVMRMHICRYEDRLFSGAEASANVRSSPPKAHLPGKGVPYPQFGEGGSPFKPGRVREAHCTAGAVGASASGAKWWQCANAGLLHTVDDEAGDVPGWVLITLMTAGLVVLIWAVAGPALTNLFEQAIARVSGL